MQDSKEIPDPASVINTALATLKIATTHSDACLAETRHWLNNDGLSDPELEDLTALPFVTIDNPDSRDLDQALLIETIPQGYRVRYALADASYYIRPGTALFDEALSRGTTYYTPVMAAPMLPVDLSEGLISLNAQVNRRALVFDIQLDDDVQVRHCTIVRARVRSRAKLNYAGVQAWLDSNETPSEAFHPSLRLLEELGEKLIVASAQRGVIAFDRTETAIVVTGSPPRFQASLRQRYKTERYNEQISLLCNMQGAQLLLGLSGVTDMLQAVFRVHEAPLRKSLNHLRDTLNAFAAREPDAEHWRWKESQSLADYVDTLPAADRHRRRVRAIQRQIMQAQRASVFKPEAGEHHALKACSYARFSSPMREVVGIFTHKELLEALGGEFSHNEHDAALREQIIEAANAARQRQRQLDKAIEFAALYAMFTHELSRQPAPWHGATLMGMRSDRMYINLDDVALDIKLYIDDLQDQFDTLYAFSDVCAEPADASKPVWHLGQALLVSIRSYDRERKRFRFSIRDAE